MERKQRVTGRLEQVCFNHAAAALSAVRTCTVTRPRENAEEIVKSSELFVYGHTHTHTHKHITLLMHFVKTLKKRFPHVAYKLHFQ